MLEINRFLTEDLLMQAAPEHNVPDSKVTLLEVLNRAASKVGERLSDQPDVEAAVRKNDRRHLPRPRGFLRERAALCRVLEIERDRSGPQSAETWLIASGENRTHASSPR